MPGEILVFRCPCGFSQDDVFVGATQTGEYVVVLCLECHRIVSLFQRTRRRRRDDPEQRPVCRKCGKPLLRITDRGVCGIPGREEFVLEDTEPWLDLFPGPKVRILCPRCHSLSLTYVAIGNWD